ncbi:MAG: branched-chain amino acid aminotransferase [Candidatus Neomarinimicrobiota bacterium]
MTVESEVMTEIDWENLTFSITPTHSMYLARCNEGESWKPGKLVPFGDISLSPAAGVLNYGQGIFEGTKAFRTVKGRIALFRPDRNAKRFRESAERLCIPPVPEDMFLNAVVETVRDNEEFVPPPDKGSLYVRPCIWGTGPVLGVKPAPSYTFLIYVSPVGPYFKGGMKCLHLKVTRLFHRAAPRGTGNAKAIGNYAASLYPLKLAKERGFDEVIYLNAGDENLVEEVGSANLFALKDGTLRTPRLGGSILPGVTRASVIELARDMLSLKVEETDVTVSDVLEADEVFCTGTAAVITPIGEITTDDAYRVIDEEIGEVTQELYDILTGIQRERREDPYDWVYPITEF